MIGANGRLECVRLWDSKWGQGRKGHILARKKQPPEIEIPYRPSPDFRTVTADGAVVSHLGDGIGTTIKVTLTRVDTQVTGEKATGKKTEEGMAISGPARINPPELCKVLECEILFRPDNAFKVAQAILDNLSRLSPEQRERYQIPKYKLEVPQPAKRRTRRKTNGTARSTAKA